jgi:hypothetical protein
MNTVFFTTGIVSLNLILSMVTVLASFYVTILFPNSSKSFQALAGWYFCSGSLDDRKEKSGFVSYINSRKEKGEISKSLQRNGRRNVEQGTQKDKLI